MKMRKNMKKLLKLIIIQMKLMTTTTIKDIEAIDILHDSYADAAIKIVY
jgi:hypothetical protein